jgi:CheY-like chemotaxis protein
MSSVLIVEDDAILRALMGEVLKSMDMRPIEAGNGVEGLIRFKSEGPHTFSAVLIDMMLPQMNGAELIQQMRLAKPDLIAILCSGFPGISHDRKTWEEMGFNGVILKPFSREEFKTQFLRALMDA